MEFRIAEQGRVEGAKFHETGRVIVPEKVVIEGVQYEPGFLRVTGNLDSKMIEILSFTKKEEAMRFGEAYISKNDGKPVGDVLDSQLKGIQPDSFKALFEKD